jgi:uncharacterized SAM-binding protein YcdF (DUF218 family)
MKGIIIILGSPNDDTGGLSEIAIGRNLQGIKEYKTHKNYKILLTGGFGNNFNNTNKPHAYYAKQFLLEKGIPEDDILEFAESGYTIEDATLTKPIVDKYKIKDLIIVTSDFHLDRVKIIFERVFRGYNLTFSGAKTKFSQEKYNQLIEHEKKEIEKMKPISPKSL